MNQLFSTLLLSGLILLCANACNSSRDCRPLSGRWSNREGQDFVFQPDGKAYWLVKFGSSYDTAQFEYQLDCRQTPVAIDLKNFHTGPHSGQTLVGILEWSSDSSFRLRYEAGMAEDRPKAFEEDQTQQFFSEK